MSEEPSPEERSTPTGGAEVQPTLVPLPPGLVEQLRAQGFEIADGAGGAALVLSATSHKGPMPSASELRELEALDPGITAKWFKLVQDDVQARVTSRNGETENARNLTRASISGGKRGQWLAFVLALIAVVAAIALLLADHPWGIALLSVPVAQLLQMVRPTRLRNPRTGEDPPRT